MSALLSKFDDWSDRLSPIVVKEVRQMVRGREFNYSFGLSLLSGLVVAFFGLAEALASTGTTGSSVFSALMGCLAIVGLVVVPLGTFSALRSERVEQTLDLITQTSLTPRNIVVGKLLTQFVKLIVLFSGLAPFIAMSFLLGGIDLTTILLSLAVLFLWSLWVCALCLFVSAASQSRAMSVLLFSVLVIGAVYLLGTMSTMLLSILRLIPVAAPTFRLGYVILFSTVLCLVSMANLLLLAENRLSLPIEDRSTALRIGFFIQFLVVLACILAPALTSPSALSRASALRYLGIFGGIHLAVTAVFAVTEDMVLSRRVFRKMKRAFYNPLSIYSPGGGRGALWILLQMLIFLAAGRAFQDNEGFSWLLAICGYICFFTGVPAFMMRYFQKARARTAYLRAGILLFFSVLSVSADLFNYLITPSKIFNWNFSAYHVLSPFRALFNWNQILSLGWEAGPIAMGLVGLLAYVGLVFLGLQEDRDAAAQLD